MVAGASDQEATVKGECLELNIIEYIWRDLPRMVYCNFKPNEDVGGNSTSGSRCMGVFEYIIHRKAM